MAPQQHSAHRGDCSGREAGPQQLPGEERCGEAGGNGPYGRDPRHSEGRQPDGADGSTQYQVQRKEDSSGRRNPLASAKPQENTEDMAKKNSQSAQGQRIGIKAGKTRKGNHCGTFASVTEER